MNLWDLIQKTNQRIEIQTHKISAISIDFFYLHLLLLINSEKLNALENKIDSIYFL